MGEELGSWAAGLLVDEAWDAYEAGRYPQALAAAGRAVEAAGPLDDPVLLVRALHVQGTALRLTGDFAAALACYTRIMGLAEDPATSSRLEDSRAAAAIASAYYGWAGSARFMTGIPVRDLFRVLDAGDRWLTATGHRDWRASILLERALTHDWLGETDAAVAAAEEAYAAKIQHPAAPGYTLHAFRFLLGDLLRDAGRTADAAPHYHAILDDHGATPWNRRAAHEGLARCALADGELGTARREARAAVLLAETLGDDALCTSLDVLTGVCRADGDLNAAWQTATRYLEAAGQVGGHYRPYHATRMATDIALDRNDLETARQFVDELGRHAEALDASSGITAHAEETARRRQRLADLTATHSAKSAG